MRLRPLGERLIVKPIPPEEKAGSVYLPDSAQEKQQKGVVKAIGPGRLFDSGYRSILDVPVGATVVYSKFAGAPVQIEGEEHLVLREEDVLAVEEEGSYE